MCWGECFVLGLSFLKLNDIILLEEFLNLIGKILVKITAKLRKLLVISFQLIILPLVLFIWQYVGKLPMLINPSLGFRECLADLGAKLLPISLWAVTFNGNRFWSVIMFGGLIIIAQNAIEREFCMIWAWRDLTVEHDLLASIEALANFLLFKTLLDSVEISDVHLLLQVLLLGWCLS